MLVTSLVIAVCALAGAAAVILVRRAGSHHGRLDALRQVPPPSR